MWKQIRKHLKVFLYASFLCCVCTYHVLFDMRADLPARVERNAGNAIQSPVQSPKKSVTKSISDRGKAADVSDYLLMVNRIPGTGSEVFVLLLQWLQGPNTFAHERLDGLNFSGDVPIVHNVLEKAKIRATPVTFDYSRPFINFSKYGEQSPAYFSVLRDPLTILESRYYANIMKQHQKGDIDDIQSFEDCWLEKEPECVFEDDISYNLPISYICGDIGSNCSKLNSEWALAKSKEIVERYYPVLGLLENVNDTLKVLEYTLPQYFKQAFDFYRKRVAGFQSKWTSSSYVSALVETDMKLVFRTEYEFYNWAKARLQSQIANLQRYPEMTTVPNKFNMDDLAYNHRFRLKP